MFALVFAKVDMKKWVLLFLAFLQKIPNKILHLPYIKKLFHMLSQLKNTQQYVFIFFSRFYSAMPKITIFAESKQTKLLIPCLLYILNTFSRLRDYYFKTEPLLPTE